MYAVTGGATGKRSGRQPFVGVHFAVFVVGPVACIHRTRRLGYLLLAYIALAVGVDDSSNLRPAAPF